MFKQLKNIYPEKRIWFFFGILFGIFIIGNLVPIFYSIAKIFLFIFILSLIIDYVLLNLSKAEIQAIRSLPARLSINDFNDVTLKILSKYPFKITIDVIEELPPEFGTKGFNFKTKLNYNIELSKIYSIKPLIRGKLEFGATNIYVSTKIGILSRRFIIGGKQEIKVYPSFRQMRQYELMAISNRLSEIGIKPIRRRGNQMEFDSISRYYKGDDKRRINWKATARREDIMVNRYQDEKSQNIYCIIDTGRNMKMPFDGLSLLDYSINSGLVIANTALIKGDKAGLITFEKSISSAIQADRRPGHINRFLETLYNVKTNYQEPNYEALYSFIHHRISQRSLLFLFSNFESVYAAKRQKAVLQGLMKRHLIVVILFENTELVNLTHQTAKNIRNIYIETAAEKLVYEKRLIARELNKMGVITLLTKPSELSVNLINKYLEIKASRMI